MNNSKLGGHSSKPWQFSSNVCFSRVLNCGTNRNLVTNRPSFLKILNYFHGIITSNCSAVHRIAGENKWKTVKAWHADGIKWLNWLTCGNYATMVYMNLRRENYEQSNYSAEREGNQPKKISFDPATSTGVSQSESFATGADPDVWISIYMGCPAQFRWLRASGHQGGLELGWDLPPGRRLFRRVVHRASCWSAQRRVAKLGSPSVSLLVPP